MSNGSCFFQVILLVASANGQLVERKAPETPKPAIPESAGAVKIATPDEILGKHKEGLSEDLIISFLRTQNHSYNLSLDEVASLKKSGLSEAVITVMMDPKATVRSQSRGSGGTPSPGISEDAIAANINDPDAPHESGIYLLTEVVGENKMVVLERAAITGWKRGSIVPLPKDRVKALMQGPRASIRTSDPQPVFYFYFDERAPGLSRSRFSGTISNPNQFSLAALKSSKNGREITIASRDWFGREQSGVEDAVAFKSERVRSGVYRVTPTSALKPGEYCFIASGLALNMLMAAGDLFDFSIGPNM